MNVLVFGVGIYYQKLNKYLIDYNIIGFMDNNVNKQGKRYDGHMVYSVKEGLKLNYDRVIILSSYQNEMKKQLLELGVNQKKIICNEEILTGIYDRPESIISNNQNDDKKIKILLISHDMGLTGAPIALYYFALILVKNGYSVSVASSKTGTMVEMFLSIKVDVIIDYKLHLLPLERMEWTRKFDLIVVNTLALYYLLKDYSTKIPVIWWLHEAKDMIDCLVYDSQELNKIKYKNIYAFGVGAYPRETYAIISNGREARNFLYGVQDKFMCSNSEKLTCAQKVTFAVVGTVSETKGQLSFLNAGKNIPEDMAMFLIIGAIDNRYAGHILTLTSKMKNIKVLGEVSQGRLFDLYKQVDVVVCPSAKLDSMPIVVTEAMMLSKPVIVSDYVGQYEMVYDIEPRLTCKHNDVESLQNAMEWCISHRNILNEYGRRFRKAYEDKFSLKVFENKARNIIDNILSVDGIY